MRLGPGPVFVFESIAAARRWQTYAARGVFLLGVLAGLGLAWGWVYLEEGPIGPGSLQNLDLKDLAQLGEYFYLCIASIQLMLVLVVAPASTAGAICLDRARGTLTHMLATDLGDAEIVLGKLAARLLPLLTLVAATVPVLALASLLGGIIPEAIVVLTILTVATAILGCSLALAISVRGTKTHEVLTTVYAIEFVWVLAPLVWFLLMEAGVVTRGPTGPPAWIQAINPFVLIWAPYAWPNYLTPGSLAGVVGGMLALSTGLALYAVLRLRTEAVGAAGRRAGGWASRPGRLREWLSSWRPGPSLDDDPVLWREWRRGRPSRLTRVVWGIFFALSMFATAQGVLALSENPRKGCDHLLLVDGLQATFGLLLLSLSAPTILAEERVRGSLDVLLTTPLSTDRIVLAKWWGAFRVVPALALLPAIGGVFVAAGVPEVLPGIRRWGASPAPLAILDRIAIAVIPLALMLAQGAVIVSVGLVLATWSRRVGRAVAASVAAYVLVAFIGPFLLEIGPPILIVLGVTRDETSAEFVFQAVGGVCPILGQFLTFQTAGWPAALSRGGFYMAQGIVVLAMLAVALAGLALAMATFNRCLGRVSERPRRAPQPPRRQAGVREPHTSRIGDRAPVAIAAAAGP